MKRYIIAAGFKNGDVLCAIEYEVIGNKIVLDIDKVREAFDEYGILKTEEEVKKYFLV